MSTTRWTTREAGLAIAAEQQPSHAFELSALLGYRLQRLSASIGTLAQRESKAVAGLSLPEYRVLVVLQSQGKSGVVALQRSMLIDKAWISRTLASLVQKRLVLSEPDPDDARRTVFRLTAKGNSAATVLMDRAFKRQKQILRILSERELVQLTKLLDRVQANVDAELVNRPA